MAGKSPRTVAKNIRTKTGKPKARAANMAKPPRQGKKPGRAVKAGASQPSTSHGAAAGNRASKQTKETYYFVVTSANARISTAKPPSAERVETAGSFREVKDKAVDHLIELIDALERRLWEIKRSQDYAEYQAQLESH
ncbi:MAG: hypothetical protein HYX69_21870 [Planctomycetia bacterium]|nr:hypothetical protein [Planctomycetia bacterium]